MINRAYFFRDVSGLPELKEKTDKARQESLRSPKYNIREKVVLQNGDFETFTENFKRTYDFITPHRVFLDMNTNYEYVCLAVSSMQSDYEILVNTSGYSYARNVAIVDKKQG